MIDEIFELRKWLYDYLGFLEGKGGMKYIV